MYSLSAYEIQQHIAQIYLLIVSIVKEACINSFTCIYNGEVTHLQRTCKVTKRGKTVTKSRQLIPHPARFVHKRDNIKNDVLYNLFVR